MKRTVKLTESTLLAAGLLLLAVASPAPAAGQGNAGNPGILPPESHALGKTYGEWAAAWWQWALAIPAAVNPLNDATGANAAIGQSGPVWFLAGAGATANVTRTVTVPTGKALFFPIINTLWTTYPTDPPITIQEIRDILEWVTSDITGVACEIDGVPVKNLPAYVHQSPVFSVTMPADNFQGVPAGSYAPCIDEGYYLLLAPLPPGQHTIHFAGTSPDLGFALDITYHLTVAH
jgi:hypothetical protein